LHYLTSRHNNVYVKFFSSAVKTDKPFFGIRIYKHTVALTGFRMHGLYTVGVFD